MEDFFNWPLAGLAKLEPGQVLAERGEDPLGEFVIALALAYNDIKDVAMFMHLLVQRPPERHAAPWSGQWMGLRIHLDRLIASYLQELLKLPEAHRTLIESPQCHDMPSTRLYFAGMAAIKTLGRLTRDGQKCEVRDVLARLANCAHLGVFGVLWAFVGSRGGALRARQRARGPAPAAIRSAAA